MKITMEHFYMAAFDVHNPLCRRINTSGPAKSLFIMSNGV